MNKYNKNKKFKTYLIWCIIIALIIFMFISFAPTPEMNEIVLYP